MGPAIGPICENVPAYYARTNDLASCRQPALVEKQKPNIGECIKAHKRCKFIHKICEILLPHSSISQKFSTASVAFYCHYLFATKHLTRTKAILPYSTLICSGYFHLALPSIASYTALYQDIPVDDRSVPCCLMESW